MSEKKEILSIETLHGTFETCAYTPTYKKRKAWEPKNLKHVTSFIPSTITSIEVKVGDKVKAGDLLVGFKAMKMDNCIESEIDGVIKAVNITVGDRIPKGMLMIEFE